MRFYIVQIIIGPEITPKCILDTQDASKYIILSTNQFKVNIIKGIRFEIWKVLN